MTPASSHTDAQDDGWIVWRGGECPVPGDTLVRIRLSTGLSTDAFSALTGGVAAGGYDWSAENGTPIIAYRIVEPGK